MSETDCRRGQRSGLMSAFRGSKPLVQGARRVLIHPRIPQAVGTLMFLCLGLSVRVRASLQQMCIIAILRITLILKICSFFLNALIKACFIDLEHIFEEKNSGGGGYSYKYIFTFQNYFCFLMDKFQIECV